MRITVVARTATCAAAAAVAMLAAVASPALGVTLPSGFQDTPVLTGLKEPTNVRFAPDGRVFVAEKAGRILVYDSLEDPLPTVFADLRKQVYDNGDRGVLGLALDPGFPARPYVYALYTFDHVIGEDEPGAYPRWGQPPEYVGDPCPKPEGADVDACPVSGRLVRLTAEGDRAAEEKGAPVEDVLVEDWCQQFSSHSIGDLQFDSGGALYASGGDGASFTAGDYGQFGWPQKNQCGDPPGAVGEALEPPEGEGGALRSQDLRTPADPTTLDGSIVRINPDTGEGLSGNPMFASTDPNARRIIAYGLRNPFRFAIDPETHEVYAGNVGWSTYEEIDRFAAVPSQAYDSGWPCEEGPEPNPVYESLELDVCKGIYAEPGAASPPFFSYVHEAGVTPEDHCPREAGSALSGLAFYEGTSFPAPYDGALFFADSVRGCIYVMFPGVDGRPDPSTTTVFMSDAGLYPGIDIEVGPEGDLFYASLFGEGYGPGSVHRISYFSGNQPPVARLTASPQWAVGTLNAQLDATGSTDADGEQLSYEWDPQGDGTYEAATTNGKKSKTFTGSSNHTVAVRVKDEQGVSSIARVTVYPGDTPPQPEIAKPDEELEWRVGQRIDFEGSAEDEQDGVLPPTSLDWSTRLYHCPNGPSACHAHPLQAFPAVGAGHFTAPDHDYPSYIELTLTVVDSRGLSAARTVKIDPRTVDLAIVSNPPGLTLGAGLLSAPAPFALRSIEGSNVVLSAPQTEELGGESYAWSGWSDGGPRVHTVVANGSAIYTALYSTSAKPPAAGSGEISSPAIAKHPSRKTGRRSARFSFASSGPGVRFRCKLDRGPWRPCYSPRVYRHLEPGRHVLRIVAVDSSSGVESAPTIFRWRVLGGPGGLQRP